MTPPPPPPLNTSDIMTLQDTLALFFKEGPAMNEATPCCKKCNATVSTGRCMGGCESFDYKKYDRYHRERAFSHWPHT
jgi:hypothetical protein